VSFLLVVICVFSFSVLFYVRCFSSFSIILIICYEFVFFLYLIYGFIDFILFYFNFFQFLSFSSYHFIFISSFLNVFFICFQSQIRFCRLAFSICFVFVFYSFFPKKKVLICFLSFFLSCFTRSI